ncbi:MAG: glycosyl hydrolase family 28-related protein, partial [Acidobacteriota bacterium]
MAVVAATMAVPAVSHTRSTSSVINVRAYGARGDGIADDTAAFRKAMKVAVSARRVLFVPAGVYWLRGLRLLDGLRLDGAGRKASWLKGKLTFGSGVVVRDLKIGDAGMSAVHNRDGATNTVFENCRFRGGGGKAWTYVVDLGSRNACDHITFKNCEVERNLGVQSGADQGFNDVTIWSAVGKPVTDITFDGCHIGVSNGAGGRDTGSPRFGLECYT